MIITGAPVEQLAFEEVDYWDELVGIMDYAKKHVHATLYICWGAQAGLYHHYGIPKYGLPRKLSGIFSHTIDDPTNQLFRGFDDVFHAPHSRHTEVRGEGIARFPRWRFWPSRMRPGCLWPVRSTGGACSSQGILSTTGIRWMRSIGGMWPREWRSRLRHITTPVTMRRGPRWSARRAHAHLFYSNWLNYCVYQATPYRLDDIPTDRD